MIKKASDTDASDGKKPPKGKREAKFDKRASALRDNLRKRKAAKKADKSE